MNENNELLGLTICPFSTDICTGNDCQLWLGKDCTFNYIAGALSKLAEHILKTT